MNRIAIPILLIASTACAADVLPPANQRFVKAGGTESPSFQRHVLPLMGRLGCNGRACHGSFQGQGGFRLSLFGYDFKADHDALLVGEKPRVNVKSPLDSLILQKPAKLVPHKGGKRMEVDEWEYNLFLSWIKNGANGAREKDATFTTLDIEPREIVFAKSGEKVKLKVIAKWSDGAREDVTPLCRFRSNDEAIATVSEDGEVTATGPGDTAIVAFYDNGVAPVPVLLPVTDKLGPKYPAAPTPTKIDELVIAKLKKLGIVQSDVCTDAEFLRRVSLDLTGTLPTGEEVKQFLADTSAEKRAKTIEELLNRPTYAAWWATKICDFTGNSEANGPLGGEQALRREQAKQWYAWVYRRVNENVAYDKLVEGIVLAIGRAPSQSYSDYCKEMSGYFNKNQPADFTARATMPYYWTRRALGKADEKALSFAHAFLGVNLQCASCHKHPYDQWTKQDFDQFTVFFNGVRYGGGDRTVFTALKKEIGLEGLDEDSGVYKRKLADAVAAGKIAPFKDLSVPAPRKLAPKAKPGAKVGGRVITPKLLGGEEVVDNNYADPRQPLMDWMREDDNPYFAKAFVNRVWATYFNAGIIDPPDDLNLANPPSNPELLDYLSESFIKSGYDMKQLHRTIVSSRTYQLSWRPNETNRTDERNHSRAVLRRLPAEVAHDAVVLATASDDSLKKLHSYPIANRAIGESSCFAGRTKGDGDPYAVQLFGKPPRTINCDCERSNEPSLLQTVYLRNDPEVLRLIDRPDGWLKQATKAKGGNADELIREAYLRTLSRLPDERETRIAKKHFDGTKDTAAGLRDLLWVLVNTKEFIVNR